MSVYFAQKRKGGLIKIGWSRSVETRMAAVRAKVVGAIPGERKVEKALHERFAHLRVRGEWFKPGADLLAYIDYEAQSHKPDAEAVQTGFRIPESWMARLYELAKKMNTLQPGIGFSRARVHRLALYRGIEQLESEWKKR
jgi:hypothetical protein